MTRGVAHSAELRAQVVAAIMAGTSISQAAKQFGLNKALVSRWAASVATVATEQRAHARDPEAIGALLLELIAAHVQTLQTQLQAASRADWLAQQPAAELAQLLVAERDTLIRLLAGLRPADDPPANQARLDTPRASEDPER